MRFCKGNKRNLRNVMKLMKDYGEVSGQIMNNSKSQVYIGKGAAHRSHSITSLLGMQEDKAPFTYLGVPIFKGKPSKVHLQAVVDKRKSKWEGWQGRILSLAGRTELIRSVVIPILLHSFMIYIWPKLLLKQLQQWVKKVLWSGDILIRKTVTVAWHKVCTSKSAGGLGLRNLVSLNKIRLLCSSIYGKFDTQNLNGVHFWKPDLTSTT